jgi:hypothetical protein
MRNYELGTGTEPLTATVETGLAAQNHSTVKDFLTVQASDASPATAVVKESLTTQFCERPAQSIIVENGGTVPTISKSAWGRNE